MKHGYGLSIHRAVRDEEANPLYTCLPIDNLINRYKECTARLPLAALSFDDFSRVVIKYVSEKSLRFMSRSAKDLRAAVHVDIRRIVRLSSRSSSSNLSMTQVLIKKQINIEMDLMVESGLINEINFVN